MVGLWSDGMNWFKVFKELRQGLKPTPILVRLRRD
jgi:hypothetical protein